MEEQPGPSLEPIEHQIMRAIRGIRFGTVEITIHDSKVVQIQRTEKIRVPGNSEAK